MAAAAPGVAKVGATLVIALFIIAPLQSWSGPVNIAYGRSWPRSIAVDSGGERVYVDGMSGIYPPTGFSVGVVYPGNGSLGRVLGLPGIAGDLALDTATGTLYAAGEDTVTVVNGPDMSIERTLDLRVPIFSIALEGSTGNLLVTSGNSVLMFDTSSGKLLRNATVGQSAEGMAVDSATGTVFVASYLSSSISVLRSSDLSPVRTVQLPPQWYPSRLALDTRSAILYATTGGQTVVALNSTDYSVIKEIRVSQSDANGTYALAVGSESNRLFVATEPGTLISELDPNTGAVLSTLRVESAAYEMAVDGITGSLYVTNYHQVTIFSPESAQPAPMLPDFVTPVSLAVAVVSAAILLYLRWFRTSGGKPDAPRARQRTGPPSSPSSHRRPPIDPSR